VCHGRPLLWIELIEPFVGTFCLGHLVTLSDARGSVPSVIAKEARVLTARLLLRSFAVEDVENAVRLWTDPQVTAHIGGPRETAGLREYFRCVGENPAAVYAEDGDRWWSVTRLKTGTWIGLCGLLAKEVDGQDEIELTYFLLPEAWGHGYATEAATRLAEHALNHLKVPSLVSLIDPGNARSVGVAVSVGMALERTIPRPGGAVRRLYRLHPGGR
jgi:RimJ/RimL family protein N-acetyltransferase